ncbi:MAG: hypothetical protein JWM47_3252 [Acidimicrobiales bacterium]|nr:hypothetical protein [Acidimicrobiales bacterium]
MSARALLAVAMAAVVLAGCSDKEDAGQGHGGDRSTTTAVAGVPTTGPGIPSVTGAGADACGLVTDALITAAIGTPYRDVGVEVLNNFPSTGVMGFECEWKYRNEAGGERMLRVDLLNFDQTSEGSLDDSWAGAIKTAGALARKIDDVGDEAIGVSLPGVSSVSGRSGSWQVTALSTSDGSIASADVGALAFVVQAALEIAG